MDSHPAMCDRATQYSKPDTPIQRVQSKLPPASDINVLAPSEATTWMSTDRIQNMKINQLVLTGAHNAHAYKVLGSFPIKLEHIICQQYNVYDLLRAGVRALDIRLHDDRWCCIGRWRTARFVEVANLIGKFANEYPSELIFLLVNNGVNQMGSDLSNVLTVLQEASGFRVAKTVTPDSKVSDFTQSYRNIILFWQGKADRMYLSDSWNHTRQVQPEELVKDCELWSREQALKAMDPNRLKMVSCHVTPPADVFAVGAHLLNLDKTIVERAGEVNEQAVVRLLNTDVTERVHFLMLDFVPQHITQYLIQANFIERD